MTSCQVLALQMQFLCSQVVALYTANKLFYMPSFDL